MNNNCEYAEKEGCMCNACQSMRKTLEELKAIGAENLVSDIDGKKIIEEMKQVLKELENKKE